VSLTRTCLGPRVGTSLICFVRSLTLEAVEGIVHAVLEVEEAIVIMYSGNKLSNTAVNLMKAETPEGHTSLKRAAFILSFHP
jgi:hypothetical protein